jgi:uncharacterized membrane protein YgcG
MHRSLTFVALIAFAAMPVTAEAASITLLPQAAGQPVHVRVVRVVESANGPVSTTTTFDLVRRAPATLAMERTQPSGAPNVSVLSVQPDGSLALAEDPRGVAADADAADLLVALNLALAAIRGSDASSHASWAASVPIAPSAPPPNAPSPTANATSAGPSASLVLIQSKIAGNEFDFSGDGQATENAAQEREGREGGRSGGMGFPGGGGGFPGGGGGFPRGGRSRGGGGAEGGPAAMQVSVHVEGHADAGRVERIAITQTRSITVANMPFVNVRSWSVTIGK